MSIHCKQFFTDNLFPVVPHEIMDSLVQLCCFSPICLPNLALYLCLCCHGYIYREFYFSGETDPLAAGSPDSFDNDADKLPGGSETDSMAEYGDVDPSKFNEDGSFIG